MNLRIGLLSIALFVAASGASAAPCLPIPGTAPQSCSNDFDLAFPIGNDTALISSVETGRVSTSLKFRFITNVADAFVKVAWKDKNGAILFAGSNGGLFGFTSAVDTFQWGETVYGLFAFPGTKIERGTADFTGSVGINSPCSSFICDAGYHEFLPSPFSSANGTGTGAGNGGATVGAALADPQISITKVQGAITLFDLDPSAPDDLSLASATLALDYTSTVEWNGSEYIYRYAIANHLDEQFDVTWALAELVGSLGPNDSMSREFSSPLRPRIVRSVAESTTGNFSLSGGLSLLQPVPVPASIPLFASALACLAVRKRSRSKPGARQCKRNKATATS